MQWRESKRLCRSDKWLLQGKRGIFALVDFFFPRRCAICDRELLPFERHLCLECRQELPFTYFWKYRNNSAEIALWGRSHIERVISLFFFKGRYKKLLHRIKYKSDLPLALYLGKMLGEKILESPDYTPIDYIVPIPLHPLKRLKRGYNQSYIIAKGILRALEPEKKGRVRICCSIIRRRRFTQSQTHKNKLERWRSVREAFALCAKSEKLKKGRNPYYGKHLLIVDDVLTTGATIDACCEILAELGCKISVATIAYVE